MPPQQLDTLRRVGPTTTQSGKAFLKTAGVVMLAHADTYEKAMKGMQGAEAELNGLHTKMLGVAMGMQRDAAAQQLRLLQDLAGTGGACFDSAEFMGLLEASALRMSQVAASHVDAALARARPAKGKGAIAL